MSYFEVPTGVLLLIDTGIRAAELGSRKLAHLERPHVEVIDLNGFIDFCSTLTTESLKRPA